MAHKLTSEVMLSLPRPGAAVPNPSGTFYLMPYSHFSFDTERTSRSIAIGKIDRYHELSAADKHNHSPVVDFLSDLRFSDFVWLDDDTVLYLRPRDSEAGKPDVDTTLSDKAFKKLLAKQEDKKEGQEIWCKTLDGSSYRVGEVPVEISDLKAVQSSPSSAILAFSAEVYPEDPRLESVERLDKEYQERKEGADVQVFDKLYVRHWGEWTSAKKKLVFYVEVRKNGSSTSDELDELDIESLPSTDDGEDTKPTTMREGAPASKASQWSFSSEPKSPLAGLENIECPTRPFGDANDYDITPTHLVFVAKDPHLPEAWHSRQHVYLVPLHPRNEDEKRPKCLTSQGGARSSPVFSPLAKAQSGGGSGSDGSATEGSGKLAWLEMRKDGYEADRNRLIVYDLASCTKTGLTEDWDRSPGSLTWGEDESSLYAVAEEEGHKKLFMFDLSTLSQRSESQSISPRLLTYSGTVSSAAVLPSIVTKTKKPSSPPAPSTLLLTINSHSSPNEAYTLSVPASLREEPSLQRVSSLSTGLVEKLSLAPAEEFWFAGAAPDRQVHGFLLKPHGYEKGKKYGLAFLVHGGPQSAWASSWSTRWNPNVYAANGYVVVAINPTGSTGYGQDFTDAINRDWGGKPYKDLVAGLEFVKRVYGDMIDEERMCMLGASYGGYMAAWMQGHNDVTKFKAIVCHDGILDTRATWFNTEELFFPEYDFGGTPWEVEAEYNKWSPINHVRNWKTPQLIIHGGKDFRLPETEGIGMFNALQRKGVPSKLVYFPNENHWVLNPLNSKRWHKEVFDWMKEWVGVGATA